MTVSFFLKVNLHWLNRLGAVSNRQRPSCQLVNLLNWSMIACTGSLKMWLWVLGHFILSKITPNKIHSLIDSSRNIRRWCRLSQAAWEFKSPWNEPKYLKQVQGYITYVTLRPIEGFISDFKKACITAYFDEGKTLQNSRDPFTVIPSYGL